MEIMCYTVLYNAVIRVKTLYFLRRNICIAYCPSLIIAHVIIYKLVRLFKISGSVPTLFTYRLFR